MLQAGSCGGSSTTCCAGVAWLLLSLPLLLNSCSLHAH